MLQNLTNIARISFLLFSLYSAQMFEYLFLFTNLIIYIEIWHSLKQLNLKKKQFI